MKNSGDKIIQEQVDNIQVSFDKEAAWMRLQERLESRDEKKGNFHLGWVAVAVLLIATVLWFTLRGEREQPMVKEMTKEVTIPVAEEREPVKEDIAKVSDKSKDVSAIPQKKKVRSIASVKDDLPEVKDQIPKPVVVHEAIEPIQETPKVFATPKPKMKVVHINEVMEEQRLEERIKQSRYARENGNIFQLRHSSTAESSSKYDNNKRSLFAEYNDDYRIIQN